MTLVKIKASDYGLTETKAKEASAMFQPMLDSMVELENEYNEIIKLDVSPETCIQAKELRNKYVKIRTGTAKIHKELKSFYLQGGRFVDGWKNAQIMASEGIEENLMKIEKHYELIEKQKIEKLGEERTIELQKYEVEVIPENLGDMHPDIWGNYIAGTKANYNQKKEAEKQAKQQEIKAQEVKELHAQRYKILAPFWQFLEEGYRENEDFGLWDKGNFDQLIEGLEAKKKEYDTKQVQVKAENLRLHAEADKMLRIQKEENRKSDARLEALNNQRLEAERKIEDQKQKDIKAEQDRQDQIEAELNKGDAAKVRDLIYDIESLKAKYVFKSNKNRVLYNQVGMLLDKVVDHIQNK